MLDKETQTDISFFDSFESDISESVKISLSSESFTEEEEILSSSSPSSTKKDDEEEDDDEWKDISSTEDEEL